MTGFLVLDKPEGLTSFAALARVRHTTGQKKAGHTGTLDPMATGVLPIALGGATRFIDFLPSKDKAYRAKIRLGLTTDTLDITGKVLTRSEVQSGIEDFKWALDKFVGTIEQLPPMYSALSQGGVRLYELARQGLELERKSRRIEIYKAELLNHDPNKEEYEIEVACSAGTYVRSLADDIGSMLGCGATLSALRRISSNGFSLDKAFTAESLEGKKKEELESLLLPLDRVLEPYPEVFVTAAQAGRFVNGGALDLERLPKFDRFGFFRVYSPDGAFLGLGEANEGARELKVRRVFSAR